MNVSASAKVCRACLIEDAEDVSFESLYALDKESGININFAEMIMSNSTLNIFFGDGLPDQICCKCSSKVLELYKFKLKCEQSDLILRSRITDDIKPVIPASIIETVFEDPSYSSESEELKFLDDSFNDENFICEVCFQGFDSKSMLLQHEKSHANEKINKEKADGDKPKSVGIRKSKNIYECKDCGKKFTKPSHLERHVLTHKDKPHICSTCGKSYKFEKSLAQHARTHMGVKPHLCSICNKGFNQRSNLRDHLRTHNGEKPFLCSTCGKGFNQLGNLRQHTVRHSGVKAHLCSICGSGFASKGELSSHIRKHTGARPFVCDVCNSGFTTSSSLTKHKRIHSGEKPYECEVCNMKFSRSGILARHRRTHTGEKPHHCKYCNKKFTQKNDLRVHLMIHTGEKPYICDICGNAFRQRAALKYHIKTHMNKKNIESELSEDQIMNNHKIESVLRKNLGSDHYFTVVKVENAVTGI